MDEMRRVSRMSRQRYVLIGILFFHSVNTYMDRACISSAAKYIIHDLKITPEVWGLILGIFAIGYALFQVPAGWFADRFGPRKGLTIVVAVWSTFTALTGMARSAGQMLILRFLFGAGEAGAFPGAAQAFFRWLPVRERGIAHGINFSGSRLGAAVSLFLMPWLILKIGWRWMFAVNGLIGLIWATVWLVWFRDNPRDNKRVNAAELEAIEKGRTEDFVTAVRASFAQVFTSLNMALAMVQYFASNVTFFICLSWLPKYISDQWADDPHAVYYSAVPLVAAAFANWTAGSMVTGLYKRGYHVSSRRLTAIVGLGLGILGLVLAVWTDRLGFLGSDKARLLWFVGSFSLAIFGVDMTLSPSWAFCNDIGGGNSGAVSGSMNMIGNIGAALSAIVFPLMVDRETGSANRFFLLAAGLNAVAIAAWCLMNPNRASRARSVRAMRIRFAAMFSSLVILTASVVGLNLYRSWQRTRAAEQRPGATTPQTSQPADSAPRTPRPDTPAMDPDTPAMEPNTDAR